MGERPGAEVVDEEVAANGELEAGLTGLGAEDVGVEETHVGPFFKLPLICDAAQNFALKQETEAAETLGFEPFALGRFAKLTSEALHGRDIHEIVGNCVMGSGA